MDFPGSTSDKEPTYQYKRCKRCRFDLWVMKIPWRRAWHPTPVFCLENPTDKGYWWATIHGLTKSWIRLKKLSMHARYPFIN